MMKMMDGPLQICLYEVKSIWIFLGISIKISTFCLN
jgi:hypothetical protein